MYTNCPSCSGSIFIRPETTRFCELCGAAVDQSILKLAEIHKVRQAIASDKWSISFFGKFGLLITVVAAIFAIGLGVIARSVPDAPTKNVVAVLALFMAVCAIEMAINSWRGLKHARQAERDNQDKLRILETA